MPPRSSGSSSRCAGFSTTSRHPSTAALTGWSSSPTTILSPLGWQGTRRGLKVPRLHRRGGRKRGSRGRPPDSVRGGGGRGVRVRGRRTPSADGAPQNVNYGSGVSQRLRCGSDVARCWKLGFAAASGPAPDAADQPPYLGVGLQAGRTECKQPTDEFSTASDVAVVIPRATQATPAATANQCVTPYLLF